MKNLKLLFKRKLSENTKEDKKSFASVRSKTKTASHPEALLSDNNMVWQVFCFSFYRRGFSKFA